MSKSARVGAHTCTAYGGVRVRGHTDTDTMECMPVRIGALEFILAHENKCVVGAMHKSHDISIDVTKRQFVRMSVMLNICAFGIEDDQI